MIKSIEIKNFQSHKHTLIEFNEGLNVIIGKSDSGKSAIRRAINWVCKNRPSGDSFVSWWGGETSVTFTLFSGDVISRIKDGSKNIYRLNGKEFTAFGTDVPKEIAEVLNINEINLQSQFDKPFLLDSSAGEVSSHFNKIARIDIIDSSIKKITSWQKSIEKSMDIKSAMQTSIENDLKKFENLEQLESSTEVLEQMEQELIGLVNSKGRLTKLLNDFDIVNKEILEKENGYPYENKVLNLLELYTYIEDLKEKQEELIGLLTDITKNENIITTKTVIIKAEEQVQPLLDLYEKLNKVRKERKNLAILLADIENTESSIKIKREKLSRLEEEFNKEFPDICPLCGAVNKQHFVKGKVDTKGVELVTKAVGSQVNPKKNYL